MLLQQTMAVTSALREHLEGFRRTDANGTVLSLHQFELGALTNLMQVSEFGIEQSACTLASFITSLIVVYRFQAHTETNYACIIHLILVVCCWCGQGDSVPEEVLALIPSMSRFSEADIDALLDIIRKAFSGA